MQIAHGIVQLRLDIILIQRLNIILRHCDNKSILVAILRGIITIFRCSAIQLDAKLLCGSLTRQG